MNLLSDMTSNMPLLGMQYCFKASALLSSWSRGSEVNGDSSVEAPGISNRDLLPPREAVFAYGASVQSQSIISRPPPDIEHILKN